MRSWLRSGRLLLVLAVACQPDPVGDAGSAGNSEVDAGHASDASVRDAGIPDDAGVPDARIPDAGAPGDAATPADASTPAVDVCDVVVNFFAPNCVTCHQP